MKGLLDVFASRNRSHLVGRTIAVIVANMVSGFALAWILRIKLGSDPCSTMNVGVTSHIPLSFGTWNLLMQTVMFCIVLTKDRTRFGIGTIANMVMGGYSADFFGWLIDQCLPESFFQPMPVRIAICIPALAVFILAVSVYVAVDMGVSPYDAMPFVITQCQSRFSFRTIRTAWDMSILAVGIVTGASFGVVTVIMAFTLGSMITWVSGQINARFLAPQSA